MKKGSKVKAGRNQIGRSETGFAKRLVKDGGLRVNAETMKGFAKSSGGDALVGALGQLAVEINTKGGSFEDQAKRVAPAVVLPPRAPTRSVPRNPLPPQSRGSRPWVVSRGNAFWGTAPQEEKKQA